MNKHLIAIVLVLSSFLLKATALNEEPSSYKWYSPNHIITQFAGNIGFLSVGVGNEFFKGRLSSNLLIGYVPYSIGKVTIFTISQKNTFRARNFKSELFNRFYPLAGFSINMETGNNSFVFVPDIYPENYYGPHAFTFSIFGGLAYQGMVFSNSIFKQLEYYTEIGTLATYLYYNIKNSDYFNPNIWSLAIGIKLKM